MSKHTGGPAFPHHETQAHGNISCVEAGMTLHDYYAAKALQGFCANPAVFAANGMSGWDLVNCTEEQLAGVCARLADEMLKARKTAA